MPRFAANLSMLYPELDFLDRFEAAARDGFKAVEFLFPYDFPAADIAVQLKKHKLTQALFNCPPGDWQKGERGMASLPGREDEFRTSIDRALEYAAVIGNKTLHVMAGLIRPDQDRARHREVYVRNLRHAAQAARSAGITIVIEPINTRSIPGFFLNRQDEAHAVRAEVGEPNLKVQMDLFHVQIVEGDIAMKMRQYMKGVGHMQVAGVPDRHEPDTGEVNYPYLFALMDELGYAGWVGCEYHPKKGTSEGLGWARPYLR